MVLVAFAGGGSGTWRVISLQPVKGEPLPHVPYVSVLEGVSAAAAAPAAAPSPCDAEAAERSSGSGSSGGSSSSAWVLHGVTSNLRYTSGEELAAMVAVQEGLGRPAATLAALIPIRKSPAWWALPQVLQQLPHMQRPRNAGVTYWQVRQHFSPLYYVCLHVTLQPGAWRQNRPPSPPAPPLRFLPLQDARLGLMASSRHIPIGMEALPGVARRSVPASRGRVLNRELAFYS